MLGHVLLRYFFERGEHDVFATARNIRDAQIHFPEQIFRRFLQINIDMENFVAFAGALASLQPDVVINCIGIIKQSPAANDPLTAITINAQLPHRIYHACREAGARLVHISTDCVFDGRKGMYTEEDSPCADDLYGRTKLLGEVDYDNSVTLRTSLIGHELKSRYGLIEWFLNQSGAVKGYRNAIFSGFPTIEIARIIHDYVLPEEKLKGIYHVSSEPISKYDLLTMVSAIYEKKIEIEPYEGFFIDRSLRSDLFRERTGYAAPPWRALIESMHRDFALHREQYISSIHAD